MGEHVPRPWGLKDLLAVLIIFGGCLVGWTWFFVWLGRTV